MSDPYDLPYPEQELPSGERLRIPPHSNQAEQSLLGGLMLDNQTWDSVADKVGEGDFYRREHRLIFGAIRDLAAREQPFDVVTLAEMLERTGQLEDAGGLPYLGVIATGTPSAANVKAYAKIVRERSVLRQLISVGTGISDIAFNTEGREVAELLDEAERRVFEIAEQEQRGGGGFQSLRGLLGRAVERIEILFQRNEPITGLPTGFADFDEMTSGLQPSDLIIVAGRPSMGKTSFAMNLAENVALEVKRPVAIFSMEMPGDALAMRMMSSLGRIDQHRVRTGKLEEDEWPRLTSAVNMLADAPVYIDDTPALSPTEVRARARRLKREHGDLALIVLDYLQLMQVPGNSENRATEISAISRSLKALAKELKVPVVALSQLNRSLEQRPNKRPVKTPSIASFRLRASRISETLDTALGDIALGGDDALDAVLGGLAQPVRAVGHGADFAAQTHLAEDRQLQVQGPVAIAGEHRQQHRQVGGGLGDAHAAHHVDEDIPVEHGQTAVAVEHGQEHGQAILLQAQGHAPGVGQGALVHQGLDLDQEGPGALAGDHDQAAGHGLVVAGEEDGGGVADLLQAAVRHGEDAQFVDGAEAVLDRAHQPVRAAGLALEIEDGIDHVLQHPGPGQGPFLGDVSHQEDAGIALLGPAHQLRRRLPHLGYGAGRGRQEVGVGGLDGVHHQDPGLLAGGGGEDAFDPGLRQQADAGAAQAQAAGAQAHLLGRFLAGDVEHRPFGPQAGTQGGAGLEQEGGLADARVAADQDHGPGHQATAQDPVQFGDATAGARLPFRTDRLQGQDPGAVRGARIALPATARRRDARDLLDGVPGAAIRATPGPFVEAGAAATTDVGQTDLGGRCGQ